MTLAIDIEKAKIAKYELLKFHKGLVELCEGLENILSEIDPDEGEAIEEIALIFRGKISEFEDRIYQVKMLIDALERIILVWENTENKNVEKAEVSHFSLIEYISDIFRIDDYIRGVLQGLFR